MAGLRCLFVLTVAFMLSELSQQQVVNVAVGRPAEQHTDLYWAGFNWTADKAVDDCLARTDPEYSRCCSASQLMPDQRQENYWRLNLTRQYEVETIVIYGRNRSGGLDHLSGFELYISETESGTQELITEPPSEVDSIYTFPFSPFKKVTEITIRRPQAADAIIMLCEVQVFAVCDDGTYGLSCSQTCGHCVDSCNTTDGSCPTGCLAGWQGDMCLQVCDNGTYGVNCSEICGHCVDSCNTTDGICPSGCLAGWHGDMCMKACLHNTYGVNCSLTCGKCLDGRQCDKKNGTCLMGCDPGWQGDMCDNACPDGSYGQNCTQTCGGCFGPEVCNKATGRCLSGCAIGWTGHLCSQVSVQPESTPCSNNIIFILGGILAVQSVFILGILGYKLFKRHGKRKKKEEKDNYFTALPRTSDRPSHVYEGESDYTCITIS